MKVADTKNTTTTANSNAPFFQKGEQNSFFNPGGEHSFFGESGMNSLPVQAKLTIGQPNDKYEQEADAMAGKVVQRLSQEDKVQAKPIETNTSVTHLVQTKCTDCGKEEKLQMEEEKEIGDVAEESLQKKPVFETPSPPNDEDDNIQRKLTEDEPEEKLQKKSDNNNSQPEASSTIESKLSASRGSGSKLPDDTRTQMESAFGADFTGVRVHNDSSAIQLNKDLQANAFTQGNDLYFNSGKYDPQSKDGQRLLAHELTHTIQQGSSQASDSSRNMNGVGGNLAQTIQSKSSEPGVQKIQRNIIDDFVKKHLLTGNAVVDFIIGVVAGIIEWVGDLIMGLVTLIKEAFTGNIGAIIALGIIIVIIVLAVIFPEVVIPILMGIGIVLGVISMAYYLYMMFRPGLTPYERGKFLGKALVEALLIFLTVAESIRFIKTFGQVAKLAEDASLLQKLRWVRLLMKAGNLEKVLKVLDEVKDIEKTIEILSLVNDVDKVLELLRLEKNVDVLLDLLKVERVAAEDLLELLRISGVTGEDIKDLLKTPGMTVEDLKDLLRRPGMTAADLKNLMSKPGMTVAELKDLLGRKGMTVELLKDLMGRPGMTVAELKDLLGRPGMTVEELKGLLDKPGVTIPLLKDLLGRPGMTVQELKDLLNKPGMTAADLKDLLDIPKMTLAQLKKLMSITDSVAQLKGFFTRIDDPIELERLINSAGIGATPGPDALRLERALNSMPAGKQPIPAIEAALEAQKKIDKKILVGEQVGTKAGTADFRTIRGGHSPSILSDPQFTIISRASNADGTTVVKFQKQVAPGPPPILSKTKTSTLAPSSWSDNDILRAGDEVAKEPPVLTRATDGATLHRKIVNGVQWEVIKDSTGKVTSSYPTGGVPTTTF